MKINQKNLNKLNKWSLRQGFTIYWGEEDAVLGQENQIHIKRGKKELYALLHECGHVIAFNKSNYSQKYQMILKSEENGNLRKTNRYKYEKMMEEILAWENGYKLAKKLKIKINEDDYFNEAAKWVGTYRRHL